MAALRILRRSCRERRGVRTTPPPLMRLVRWVLACFCLSLGVAIASPVVHPQSFELVCSTAGAAKVLVHTEDGARELGASHLDCPLCLPAALAPPPAVAVLPALLQPALAPQPVPAAFLAVANGLPPPARGPPASFS